MPIKLLALDIDGTLLNSRGELTDRNRAALDEVRRRGVLVVLLTGRRFGSAYQLLRELGLDLPLIAHNGALTKDPSTLETIDARPLEVDAAHEIIRFARRERVDMICCSDEECGPGRMVIEGISQDNRALNRYLQRYSDALVEVSDLIDYVDSPPIQIMFSGGCDRMEEFAGLLDSLMPGRARVFKTRYPRVDLTILDAVSTLASKGNSLERIAGMKGLAREEVMAVGDNHNDLTMLSYAGIGVVMGNAEDDLKALGFALTSSNEESGVAEAIERFILD